MAKRYTPEQLEKKVKQIEGYLGSRLDYNFSEWPKPGKDYWSLRWLMEYCMLLKERYYRGLKREKWKKKLISTGSKRKY